MPTLAERFRDDLRRVSRLPSAPQVLTRLLRVLSARDVALPEVSGVIAEDPVLTAQVLKIANSAAYAPRVPILAVGDALMRIGLAQTRRLALALSVYNIVPQRDLLVHQRNFWLHSLGVAHAAAVVSRHARGGLDETRAYVLGLLHDLGLIALAGYYPAEYAAVKEAAARSELPFYAAEAPLLGTDHGALGAMLAEHWGLPRVLVDGIRTHHRLDEAPPDVRLDVQVLYLAERLAHSAGIPDLGEGWVAGVEANAMEELELPEGSEGDLVWETRAETERSEGLLGLVR
jgi:HD-like signal output (HDOD) protein